MRSAQILTADPNRSIKLLSNDIKARQWQDAHIELRQKLNEVLRISERKTAIDEMLVIRSLFYGRLTESEDVIANSDSIIFSAVKREDYGCVMQTALELSRHKARLQTYKVIVDELDAFVACFRPQISQGLNIDSKLAPSNLTDSFAPAQMIPVRPCQAVSLAKSQKAMAQTTRVAGNSSNSIGAGRHLQRLDGNSRKGEISSINTPRADSAFPEQERATVIPFNLLRANVAGRKR